MTRFLRTLVLATTVLLLPPPGVIADEALAIDVSLEAAPADPTAASAKVVPDAQTANSAPQHDAAESTASDTAEPAAEPEPEPEPEDPPLVQDGRRLIAHLVGLERRIEELNQAFKGTAGDDAEVLDRQIAEAKLDFLDTIAKMVRNLGEQEEEGLDGAEVRGVLKFQLERLGPAIVEHIEAGVDELSSLRNLRGSTDPSELAALEVQISRQISWLLALLQAYSDQVQNMATLGLDNEALARDLSRRLANRADRLLGRVQLVDERLLDLKGRLAKTPDDKELAATIEIARQRKNSMIDALKHVTDLMDVSGLDSSQYRQFVIRSTGEVSVDVFRTSVMRSLLDELAEEVTKRARESGPYILAQAFAFLLILALFKVLATITGRLTERAMARSSTGISQLQRTMLLSLANRGVMLIGILVALSQLGIELGPLLAGLGIAGFIVGFALQDSLANFASGVMILAYRPFDVADFIEAGGVRGNVSHMSLVSTTIMTFDNQTLIVPNTKIWGDVIKNITNQDKRRVDMTFHVSYDDEMDRAERVFAAICADHPKVLADPQPMIKVHRLGKSSIEFAVRPWVETEDYWEVYWDVTREVRKRFVAEDFTTPLPQRDIHLRAPDTGRGPSES